MEYYELFYSCTLTDEQYEVLVENAFSEGQRMHALIVGPRGVGKSTLIQRVLKELKRPAFDFETKKETQLEIEVLDCPVYIYDAEMESLWSREYLVSYCKNKQLTTYAEAFERYAPKLRKPNRKHSVMRSCRF